MNYLEILKKIPLPQMALLRQHFNNDHIENPGEVLYQKLLYHPAAKKIKPGMNIAVTAGSRGIAEYPTLLRSLIDAIRTCGGNPFIVPAMGSHGGGTSEGQLAILKGFGIDETTMGCPVLSSIEAVCIGKLDDGTPIYMDRITQEKADGIVLFNRIKAHNAFHGRIESGLAKMLAIGLGKQAGADACHVLGFNHMADRVYAIAEQKLKSCPVLFGVGTLENAYDNVRDILITLPENLLKEESQALEESKKFMPSLPFGGTQDPSSKPRLDVLIIDEIGKEFSGGGMDSNITGRYSQYKNHDGPIIDVLVALDLSEASHGNAIGIGLADVTTERLVAKFNRSSVYTNSLTAHVSVGAKMPVVMPNDKAAIKAALVYAQLQNPCLARMVRIPNTLHLDFVYASEVIMSELKDLVDVEIISPVQGMQFDAHDNLIPF